MLHFEPEERFKIGVLYFISTFLTGFEVSKTSIPKLYFDLVESGQYVNFPWGTECFMLTLKACSCRLGNNPTSFKFSQFHLALQIWFYERCHPFDNTVAIRFANGTPRILNWKTSNETLTDEEMNATDQNNLHESSSHHEMKNQATLERNDVDLNEKYVELKEGIAEVRQELKELKDNVDKHMTELKAYVNNSTKLIIDEIRMMPINMLKKLNKTRMDQPSVSMREYIDISNTDAKAQNSIDQTVGGVFNADIPGSSTSKPPTLNNYPDLTMTQIELDSILNVTTTLDLLPRNRNPGKYDTSSYIRLLEGESSVKRGPIFSRIKHRFESHNGIEVAAELIDEFNK
ncbi:hypothetical protein KY290_008036 [Solanum tuberosum]|uniref:DUF1985 domain-containing protein n=1 Tax=Solanum tuberosum TaxID=4113 RepID=A0ABQ7W9D6_SOLTU|nr:hypothetical protein KY290_008036 [Solanum tuberosum]